LDFSQDTIAELINYFKTKSPKTQNEEVGVVMKWYKDYSGKTEISIKEINYLLSICSKVPSALDQVLINMKGSKFRWVSYGNQEKVKLTSIGETYINTKLISNNK
jgi:hypothetical protein